MGDRRRQAEMLWRLGYALHALGRHGQARASWRESRKIFEELGMPFPRHRGLKGTLWS
jgi:hypothetical protein